MLKIEGAKIEESLGNGNPKFQVSNSRLRFKMSFRVTINLFQDCSSIPTK